MVLGHEHLPSHHMDIQVIDFILFEKKISLRRSVKSGCKHPWWIERDGKNFSYFLSLYHFQGGATSIQLETLHFLDLSRGDSHLQYRNSGEVRRGEEKAKETWKSGGSRKNDS